MCMVPLVFFYVFSLAIFLLQPIQRRGLDALGQGHVPLAPGPRQGPGRRVVGRADGGVRVVVCVSSKRASGAAAKYKIASRCLVSIQAAS